MNYELEKHGIEYWDTMIFEFRKSKLIENYVPENYAIKRLLFSNERCLIVICKDVVSKMVLLDISEEILVYFKKVLTPKMNIQLMTSKEYENLFGDDDIKKVQKISSILTYNNTMEEYRFDNFVVGPCNQESYLSSFECASNPGMIFTPLFIYGNSGLGKTHLLHSIGNYVNENDPSKKVYYTSGMEFVKRVVNSIKEKSIEQFNEELYDIDVLLMDDIQFLAGKEKSHEVFFYAFNELVSNKKQIVITSDRHPNDIKGLEERMISRFTSGLSVKIEVPEYETAISILKQKLANQIGEETMIDENVLGFLASHFSRDVRLLEGSVKRLLFYSIQFSNQKHIDLALAKEAFKNEIDSSKEQELSSKRIKRVVADYYGLSITQLESKARASNIVNARQIAMYLCRTMLDLPLLKIGKEFGNRDHTTVMNACQKIEKLIKKDKLFLQAIIEIKSKI